MIPLYDSHPARRFPYWTILIILLNVFVFFLEITSSNPDLITQQFALIPANVNFGDLKTLLPFFTSQFLHGGFLHIISNMWFLWIFGDNVEGELGWFGFPILYLLSGFVGGLAQYVFMPDTTIPMLGASGAIAGVLGAYFAWFPHHKVKTLIIFFGFITLINIPAYYMLLYWIVTQFFSGAFSLKSSMADASGIAYFAHIGGFIVGYLTAKLVVQKVPVLVPIDEA